ncbi:MAG: RIP metalloprotease RseP [Bdellovibrionota bacterium]
METLLSYLQSGATGTLSFVLLLGVLIFVHELGHFLVARWCGIRVETFSLGFGKKILQMKRGHTTYCVSLIPLGGYVKMFGEQPFSGDMVGEGENQRPMTAEEKNQSFTHKNVWQRIAVVMAGPLMNFFFAVLIFTLVALIGENTKGPLLGDVASPSLAEQQGFKSGDLLLKVEDSDINTWEDFQKQLNKKIHTNEADSQIAVLVQREGLSHPLEIKAVVSRRPNTNPISSEKFVGDIDGLNPYSRSSHVGVPANSPMTLLGMKTGDRIASINDMKVTHFRELDPLLKKVDPKQPLNLEIERLANDEKKTEKISIQWSPQEKIKEYSLATLKLETTDLYLGRILKKTPADSAGLKPWDKIISIDTKAVTKWDDVLNAIKSYSGTQPMSIEVMRGVEKKMFEITPQMTSQMLPTGAEDKRYTIGINALLMYSDIDFVRVKAKGMGAAIARAFTRSVDMSVMTLNVFKKLIFGEISHKNIGGVISIAQAAHDSFISGLSSFLLMMGFISINLFVLNLLPVPVLDGGHMVFYIIELLKGSPLSLKKMEMAQQVGMVLLMSLMVFALFNDVSRVFFTSQ